MFTISQIKEAHSKVKSGADFPAYIQDLKVLGITRYAHFVSDGHIQYFGINNLSISGEPKWEQWAIAPDFSKEELKAKLIVHQRGETDYPTFCRHSAECGVAKWIVDIAEMTCIYYSSSNEEILTETIPG